LSRVFCPGCWWHVWRCFAYCDSSFHTIPTLLSPPPPFPLAPPCTPPVDISLPPHTHPRRCYWQVAAMPFSKSTQFGTEDIHELASLLGENPGKPCRLPKVRGLYCTYTMRILCLYCTYTVLILCLCCTYTVLMLYSYCKLILYSYCTHTVLILYSYCALAAFRRPRQCLRPVPAAAV
jgi:hypothetical protein